MSKISRKTKSKPGAARLGALPEWDLSALYGGLDDPAIKRDLDRTDADCLAFEFYEVWTVMQNEMAALSTNSTHVVAEHGGHHLNHGNPELVANALTSLVKQVRAAGQEAR